MKVTKVDAKALFHSSLLEGSMTLLSSMTLQHKENSMPAMQCNRYWLSFLETNCTSVDDRPHVIVGSPADILQSRGGDLRVKLNFVNTLLEESVISTN